MYTSFNTIILTKTNWTLKIGFVHSYLLSLSFLCLIALCWVILCSIVKIRIIEAYLFWHLQSGIHAPLFIQRLKDQNPFKDSTGVWLVVHQKYFEKFGVFLQIFSRQKFCLRLKDYLILHSFIMKIKSFISNNSGSKSKTPINYAVSLASIHT